MLPTNNPKPTAVPVIAESLSYGSIGAPQASTETSHLFPRADVAADKDPSSLPPLVRFSERERRNGAVDRIARVVFGICLLLHFSFCIFFLVAHNVCVTQPEGICPGTQLRRDYDICLSRYKLPPMVRSLAENEKGQTVVSLADFGSGSDLLSRSHSAPAPKVRSLAAKDKAVELRSSERRPESLARLGPASELSYVGKEDQAVSMPASVSGSALFVEAASALRVASFSENDAGVSLSGLSEGWEVISDSGSVLPEKRWLGDASNAAVSLSMFEVLRRHFWIPMIVLCGIPVVVLLWLKLLACASRGITWTSLIFGCVLYILIGANLRETSSSSVGLAFIFYGIGLLVVSVVSLYGSIDKAAHSLQTGCAFLLRNPYVFVASGVLEIFMLLCLAFTIIAVASSYQIWNVEDTGSGCELHVLPYGVNHLRNFCLLFLSWLLLFFDAAKLVTTAMCIGSQLFAQSQFGGSADQASSVPFRALRIAVTSSAGTLAIGSLAVAIVERLVQNKKQRTWWLSVSGCIYHYAIAHCEEAIMAMNRFALIAHAFSGDGFLGASRRAYHVMSRNFVSSMVVDQVGVLVLQSAAKAVSLCFLLLTWFLIDESQGWKSLSNISAILQHSTLAIVAFIIVLLVLLDYPLLGVVLIAWFQESVAARVCSTADTCEIHAPMAGLFMGCIARLIFNFQASVLLHALDSVFISYAISKDTRVKLADDRLYAYVESSDQLL